LLRRHVSVYKKMMTQFLTGFALSFGLLLLLGITRAQWLSQRMWVILWTLYSLGLAVFIVISFLGRHLVLDGWALGAALGYVVAVGWHTFHHALEEMRGQEDEK
jgi:hypothetical protein